MLPEFESRLNGSWVPNTLEPFRSKESIDSDTPPRLIGRAPVSASTNQNVSEEHIQRERRSVSGRTILVNTRIKLASRVVVVDGGGHPVNLCDICDEVAFARTAVGRV